MQGIHDRLAQGLAALGLAAACAAHASGAPRVIYVDCSAPPGGDGTSWQTAFRDLQDAIRVRIDQDAEVEVRIAQGVYTPDSGTLDRERYFRFHSFLGSAMTLSVLGSFAGLRGQEPDARDYVATRTVLSGDLKGDDGPDMANRTDNSHMLVIVGAKRQLLIDGLTVRGASTIDAPAFAFGGGMIAFAQPRDPDGPPALLRVSNCTFEENTATRAPAGGLSAAAGIVELVGCDFRGNTNADGNGGGLSISSRAGFAYVSGCTFESNAALFGGGVFSDEHATVEQCEFVGNTAAFQGGGYFGSASIRSTLFARNSSGSSGGAIAGNGQLLIRSCTIADNTAASSPAIALANGALDLRNSIVWRNIAPVGGAAVRLADSLSASHISECVLQGGVEGVAASGVAVTFGAAIVDADPHFIRPADPGVARSNWNYRLGPASLAIGIGGGDVNIDLDNHLYAYIVAAPPPDSGCYFFTKYSCEGDLARDWLVDDSDFERFVEAYDLTIAPPADPDADLNHDGLVDDADFSMFVIGYDRLLCPDPW